MLFEFLLYTYRNTGSGLQKAKETLGSRKSLPDIWKCSLKGDCATLLPQRQKSHYAVWVFSQQLTKHGVRPPKGQRDPWVSKEPAGHLKMLLKRWLCKALTSKSKISLCCLSFFPTVNETQGQVAKRPKKGTIGSQGPERGSLQSRNRLLESWKQLGARPKTLPEVSKYSLVARQVKNSISHKSLYNTLTKTRGQAA